MNIFLTPGNAKYIVTEIVIALTAESLVRKKNISHPQNRHNKISEPWSRDITSLSVVSCNFSGVAVKMENSARLNIS